MLKCLAAFAKQQNPTLAASTVTQLGVRHRNSTHTASTQKFMISELYKIFLRRLVLKQHTNRDHIIDNEQFNKIKNACNLVGTSDNSGKGANNSVFNFIENMIKTDFHLLGIAAHELASLQVKLISVIFSNSTVTTSLASNCKAVRVNLYSQLDDKNSKANNNAKKYILYNSPEPEPLPSSWQHSTSKSEQTYANNMNKEHNKSDRAKPFMTHSEKILVLNDDNFKSAILKYNLLLVLFYAPWCKYCRDIKPIFLRVAKELPKGAGHLAVCNAEESVRVSLKYKVYEFPTMKLFNEGKHLTDYTGPRRSLEIIKFMISHSDEYIHSQ